MPTLEWNKDTWDHSYSWSHRGEEWSLPWGNSEAQWFGSLYPRIHAFLPARRVLEIAPGFGRWTRFLHEHCDEYTGIDLSNACIEHCQNHFSKGTFLVNDGFSLDAVPDGSIDFCFSFDSLVHASSDVFEAYIPQIISKLSPQGIAFIHHSNAAIYPNRDDVKQTHQRDFSVSANTMRSLIETHSGHAIVQECVNWCGDLLIDCMTTFAKKEHLHFSKNQTKLLNNSCFMIEASLICKVLSQYSSKNL